MTNGPSATLERPAETATQTDRSRLVDASGGRVLQIVSFQLGKEEYGVDIMLAQEIIMVGQITKIPEVPDYVRGLINLRGHVIPVIDLRKRFGLPANESEEEARIIVVNVDKKAVGIVVDAVTEVLRINVDQIEPAPSSVRRVNGSYIRGIAKQGDRLIVLLKIEDILSSESLDLGEAPPLVGDQDR